MLRALSLAALVLSASACAWRGEGPDPTRYPWDQAAPKASYCIMSLELSGARGISVRGAPHLVCKPPPPRRR